jgi:glycosyltransferase 2 family protein
VRGRWWRLLIGLILATVAVIWIALRVDPSELSGALEPIPWRYLALATVLMGADFSLRITRWWLLVKAAGAGAPWGACATALLTSTAANNLLPLRFGDVLRVTAFPTLGLGPARLSGTLITERLLDLWSLLGIAALSTQVLIGALAPPLLLTSIWAGWLVTGGVLVGLASQDLDGIKRWLRRSTSQTVQSAGRVLDDVHTAMRRGASGPTLLYSMVLSLGAWLLEGSAFAIVLMAVVPAVPWELGWPSMGIATLSTLVPAAPGFIGTFHAAAMQPPLWAGTDTTLAAAYAVLVHAVVWLPVTVVGSAIGSIALMTGQITLRPSARTSLAGNAARNHEE